jgi:uncharacterized protein YndB with AHSA1/START domain
MDRDEQAVRLVSGQVMINGSLQVTTSPADRIEKQVLLRAPHARVWRALTEPREFGRWSGLEFDGTFTAGARLTGFICPTAVDANVAKVQQPYEGTRFEIAIDRIDAERLFAFRWHPSTLAPERDYACEAVTLVEFHLEDVPEGVVLTITESGFDRVPLDRRTVVFAANEAGWTIQIRLIEKYLAGCAILSGDTLPPISAVPRPRIP